MISLRNALRSAPRNVARLAGGSSPISSAISRRAARAVLPTRFAMASHNGFVSNQLRALSTSFQARSPAGETDEELSAKLESEIQFEREVKDDDIVPASIKDFLENGPFEIVDTPGQEEVVLTREFGNEKITVTFSIADLSSYEAENDMFDEDEALSGEDIDGNSPDPTARPGATGGRPENELVDGAVEEDLGEPDADTAVPCRLNIVVEKPGKGALNIEATAQDGNILVENLYYYADAALAHGKNADAAHAAQAVYPGPPFGSLDEDLQILMERYLEERGITQALAVFVPDYMDVKEQREYLTWLANLKEFVDA